ncbi:MAG TPA: hypothetical protein VKE51_41545 [Vicinamibacterales bacterium]|nr:hypothetical protein [Vicinamibacterales bacterium]
MTSHQGPRSRLATATVLAVAALVYVGAASTGQLTEHPLAVALTSPAIGYFTRPTTDLVSGLNRRLEEGTAHLAFDASSGYLTSVLEALHVPVESQMLVISKTGVQALYTEPSNPRAILFNDAVAVGYIRGAPLLEFAVQDPHQGVLFYTLDQKAQERPRFERPSACVRCHQVYSTLHVPGMLARSSFVGGDGLPLGQFGTYDVDDRTPFGKRWGGWYVTGTHGSMRHMGNAIVTRAGDRETAISDRTLNRTSLDGQFDPHGYASAQSDIVALMVFAHQSHMTNLITRLGWEARIASVDAPLDVTRAPLRDAVEELVDYALFVDEEPLTAPVRGTSGFAAAFSARGPLDRRGRSLRQLDLERRLFRYPCSFMLYSEAFAALPDAVREAIYDRIWDVLSGRETNPRYARLSPVDRSAVLQILRDTLQDLPQRFGTP